MGHARVQTRNYKERVLLPPHSIGCYFPTPLDYHTVEAHGCKCAIIQVATSNNVGLAFNIIAESSRGATLHATFSSWNNDRLDEARELVDKLAESICVYESDTPSYVRDLQECLDSQVDPDHLFEVIARYGSVLENIKKETPDIARFVKQAYKADQRTEHERLIAAVEKYAESNKSVEPYLELLADVADAQARYLKEDSANLDKLRQIVAETSRGSIFFPNSLPRDFRKLPQQEREEVERVLAPSERTRAILSRIGVEWPNSDNADDGSDSDAVVPDLPTVMLTLLSDDYVFFQNNEISWPKGHHVIKGLQVNSPKQRDLATIAVENGFDDINDLLNYFIAFMGEVEKDEALVIPKASISKALHPIVRRGPDGNHARQPRRKHGGVQGPQRQAQQLHGHLRRHPRGRNPPLLRPDVPPALGPPPLHDVPEGRPLPGDVRTLPQPRPLPAP